jgi:V/A-type H+-transporting ATPase subunit E
MARLDVFIQEIENRKQQDIQALEKKLSEKNEEIRHTKETTIHELQNQYNEEAKIKSQKEYARIVEASKLQAKKILFESINENMNSTFDIIKQEMKNYVQKPEYKNLLKKMINYAKNTLGSDAIIHCRTNDNSILKEMNIPIVDPPINTLGGILAEDKQGTRELDLTFEELLRTKEDGVKGFLLERLMK